MKRVLIIAAAAVGLYIVWRLMGRTGIGAALANQGPGAGADPNAPPVFPTAAAAEQSVTKGWGAF